MNLVIENEVIIVFLSFLDIEVKCNPLHQSACPLDWEFLRAGNGQVFVTLYFQALACVFIKCMIEYMTKTHRIIQKI